ncbi:hypothetical protein Ccrd_021483 [Cynara cardunculus var. scolymus]|uniref:Uncharacterized protein n=1 Tax=Cynara cardunculus var. scolymus TaxID=59895 RepID=A0A118JZW3_CYNCS|nr:hypothetical protein Ccrd_021483 [Cynara cardunculus var. scolymus]
MDKEQEAKIPKLKTQSISELCLPDDQDLLNHSPMVFNTVLVASVATVSADVWQSVACFSERINTDELLDLVICFPLQQLGRFAICVWNFFCVPPSPPDSYYYSYAYYDDDESDYDSDTSSAGVGGYSAYDHVLRDSYSDPHSD